MKKKLLVLLTVLALVLSLLAACGGGSGSAQYAVSGSVNSKAAMAPSSAPAMMADGAWGGAVAESAAYDAPASQSKTEQSPLSPDTKMVYRASLEMESTEFESAHKDLETLVEQLGGYFQEQSVRNYSSGLRHGFYVVRIPAQHFKDFLSRVGELCNVVFQNQSAENITERYYDTDARLQTAKTKLARLQDLLARAENMEDIITLESAISDTEYDIESLSGTLRHYDALVGYSTIDINLQEVGRLTQVEEGPQSFGQRLASSFREGIADFGELLQDIAVDLAYNWLGLLVFAALIFGVVKLVRRVLKKRAAKKRAKEQIPPSDDPQPK